MAASNEGGGGGVEVWYATPGTVVLCSSRMKATQVLYLVSRKGENNYNTPGKYLIGICIMLVFFCSFNSRVTNSLSCDHALDFVAMR